MEILTYNVPLWAIILAALSIIYVIYMSWSYRLFTKMGVKGPMPLPVIGNLVPEIRFGFMEADERWMKKYGKVWGIFEGRTPNLFIADEETLSQLFVKKFGNFTDRQTMEGVSGDFDHSLTELKGDHWKLVRNIMTPTFSAGKLKKMTTLVKKATDTLLDSMTKKSEQGKEMEMKGVYGAFTMDVISSTAFGIKTNSQKDPNDPFVKNVARLFDLSFASPVMLIFLFAPFLLKPITKIMDIAFIPKDVQKFFRDVVVKEVNTRKTEREDYVDFMQLMIQAHEETPAGETKKDSGAFGSVSHKGWFVIHPSLLNDWMFRAKIRVKPFAGILGSIHSRMNFKEILGNSLVFFFAGYETTATTLCLFSHSMALHPEIQNRVYDEIEAELGEEEPDYDNINKLVYLDMCVTETLRMYPPATRVDRVCTADTDLNGLKIPKGLVVSVPVWAIHRSAENWTNPETFDPERFSPENKSKHSPFHFLPFGYGPRNCIGMRLALLELKISLVGVIRNFRFSVGDKTKIPPKLSTEGLLSPKELWLNVEKR